MEPSYSLHQGRNQNRTRRARTASKNTLSGTTSYSNNGIQNSRVLSKVCKHNLRLYENNNENIVTIVGTNDASNDVKNTYLELFEKSRINYNNTQTRTDRKIDNYFNYISDSKTKDLACEIIIELGNKDFWSDKDKEYKDKMINVFSKQIKDFEEVVPNFKVSNATIHLDEHSPHIHIVGVPFRDGYKNGMKRQVAKSLIFTRDSLRNIQDKMRLKCISEFNKEYNLDYTLVNKEQGRNNDIPVYLMNKTYDKYKNNIVKSRNQLTNLNNSSYKLNNGRNYVNRIINYAKNNNGYISKEDLEYLEKYNNEIFKTIKSIKNVNQLSYAINDIKLL